MDNQETLIKQVAGVSIKNEEEALFSNKRQSRSRGQHVDKDNNSKKWQNKSNQAGGADQSRGNGKRQGKPHNFECYNCGKKGHFARDCRFKKKAVKGNTTTSSNQKSSEDEWDMEASFAVVEGSRDAVTIGVAVIKNEELALAISAPSMIDYTKSWIVDSGCSNHMIGDKEKLLNMSEYKND